MQRDLYLDQAMIQPVRPPKKPAKDQPVMMAGTAVALSQGLHQGLGQGLYQDLFQGSQTPKNGASAAPKIAPVPSPAAETGPPTAAATATPDAETSIRRIVLLPGETVTHTFYPEEGLVPQPKDSGLMLVLTNQRVISFGSRDGKKETVLMPVDEVKAVAVTSGLRSKIMLFQGGLTVLAGVVIYVVLAYWLTGKVDGPTIPVIRMDLVAFLVFLAILSGVGMISQFYFSKPDGEVAFQGDGVKLIFPFRGETAENDIYQIVNSTFAARQSVVGHSAQDQARQGVT